MSGVFTASCIQFTSARDYEPNIRIVSDLVRKARDTGADFVLTPENTGLTEPVGKLRRETRQGGRSRCANTCVHVIRQRFQNRLRPCRANRPETRKDGGMDPGVLVP